MLHRIVIMVEWIDVKSQIEYENNKMKCKAKRYESKANEY